MRMLLAAGLSVLAPPGWHIAHPPLLEPCTNPAPRFALAHGKRDLIEVQESLDGPKYVARFPLRPRRFRVKGPPSYLSCCAPAREQRGWMLHFRDHGRAFYIYVYGDAHAALRVLDTLRIAPRR